ncbi:hypothetical protein EYZ11_004145 [Aspergillus tanneri]|uniref:Uncharacterized protein n=1 Tax=Aspergillus tanneri TaxID=1220188 RepID=A0A4V3UPT8_9EURO|nr:hypothetical protein EYZ11_004145 [Aspergillus tanneri]
MPGLYLFQRKYPIGWNGTLSLQS